jgi:Ase1/PRC1/MAP65 family protein
LLLGRRREAPGSSTTVYAPPWLHHLYMAYGAITAALHLGQLTFMHAQEVLLDLLEDYGNARKEKEQERKRQRDQRRQVQGAAAADRDLSSPVARPPPKAIKNVTRSLSIGRNAAAAAATAGGGSPRKAAPASSRPGTPSFLKSPLSARRGGGDEGAQMLSPDSFE